MKITKIDKTLAITKDLPAPQGTTRQAGGDYLTNPAKQTKVLDYEREIDELACLCVFARRQVYKLYELTPEEIEIVKGQK